MTRVAIWLVGATALLAILVILIAVPAHDARLVRGAGALDRFTGPCRGSEQTTDDDDVPGFMIFNDTACRLEYEHESVVDGGCSMDNTRLNPPMTASPVKDIGTGYGEFCAVTFHSPLAELDLGEYRRAVRSRVPSIEKEAVALVRQEAELSHKQGVQEEQVSTLGGLQAVYNALQASLTKEVQVATQTNVNITSVQTAETAADTLARQRDAEAATVTADMNAKIAAEAERVRQVAAAAAAAAAQTARLNAERAENERRVAAQATATLTAPARATTTATTPRAPVTTTSISRSSGYKLSRGTTITVPVTRNGRCGPGEGTKCPSGQCCSIFDWCGGGPDHCVTYRRSDSMYHG
jgi:hypothetical protein